MQSLDILILAQTATKALLWEVLLHHLLADDVMFEAEKERLQGSRQEHRIIHSLYIVILSLPCLQVMTGIGELCCYSIKALSLTCLMTLRTSNWDGDDLYNPSVLRKPFLRSVSTQHTTMAGTFVSGALSAFSRVSTGICVLNVCKGRECLIISDYTWKWVYPINSILYIATTVINSHHSTCTIFVFPCTFHPPS